MKNKKCANRSQRNVKRKLQLSPNKNKSPRNSLTHSLPTRGICDVTKSQRGSKKMRKSALMKKELFRVKLFVFVWRNNYIIFLLFCQYIAGRISGNFGFLIRSEWHFFGKAKRRGAAFCASALILFRRSLCARKGFFDRKIAKK